MGWSVYSSKFGFLELLAAVFSREWHRIFSVHEPVKARLPHFH